MDSNLLNTKDRISLAVDSTQITAFMECERKWKLSYLENLTRKYEQRTAMDRGTVIHGLLERYYRLRSTGVDQQSCYNFAITELTKVIAMKKPTMNGLSLSREDFMFCLTRFTQYTSHYAGYDFKPLIIEGNPAVEIGFSVPIVDTPTHLLVLEGRIDFIAEQQDLIFLVDHKTQGRKYDHYARTIQFMNYCIALNIQLGINVDRVMINYIGMQENLKPDEHLRRKLYYYHPRVLSEWRNKLMSVMYRMSNAIQVDRFEKNEISCQGRGFGFCPNVDICECLSENQMINIKNTKYMQKTAWTPWSEEI